MKWGRDNPYNGWPIEEAAAGRRGARMAPVGGPCRRRPLQHNLRRERRLDRVESFSAHRRPLWSRKCPSTRDQEPDMQTGQNAPSEDILEQTRRPFTGEPGPEASRMSATQCCSSESLATCCEAVARSMCCSPEAATGGGCGCR
jgi:hypothetical protein